MPRPGRPAIAMAAGIVAALCCAIAPARGEITETKFIGGRSVAIDKGDDLFRILVDGVSIATDNSDIVSIERTGVLGGVPFAILQLTNGTACPGLFKLVLLPPRGKPTVSDQFGSCSDGYDFATAGNQITLSFGPFNEAPGEIVRIDPTGVVQITKGRVSSPASPVGTAAVAPTGDAGSALTFKSHVFGETVAEALERAKADKAFTFGAGTVEQLQPTSAMYRRLLPPKLGFAVLGTEEVAGVTAGVAYFFYRPSESVPAKDAKLFAIIGSFEPKDSKMLAEAFVEKFGRPTSVDQQEIVAGNGRRLTGHVVKWSKGNATIQFDEYANEFGLSNNYDLTSSAFMIVDEAIRQSVEKVTKPRF